MEDSAQSLPSIWASMNSWFTPTVLFIFLNLMIGTILFTSNNNKQEDHKEKTHNQNDLIQSKLARSSSILHRLRSFNFHHYRSQPETPPATLQNHHHHHHHNHQQEEALEITATQYVFNHPFSHDHDLLQPVSAKLNNLDLDPTRFDSFDHGFKSETVDDQYDDFNHTNEVILAKL